MAGRIEQKQLAALLMSVHLSAAMKKNIFAFLMIVGETCQMVKMPYKRYKNKKR